MFHSIYAATIHHTLLCCAHYVVAIHNTLFFFLSANSNHQWRSITAVFKVETINHCVEAINPLCKTLVAAVFQNRAVSLLCKTLVEAVL